MKYLCYYLKTVLKFFTDEIRSETSPLPRTTFNLNLIPKQLRNFRIIK